MDMNHYNELIELSQKIYSLATEELSNYLTQKYCAVSNDTRQDQMEDYLFVMEESSAFLLGNALALLTPDSQEEEIQTFTENLRRVISVASKKKGTDTPS